MSEIPLRSLLKRQTYVLWIGHVLLGDLMIQLAMSAHMQAYELRAVGTPDFNSLARQEGI